MIIYRRDSREDTRPISSIPAYRYHDRLCLISQWSADMRRVYIRFIDSNVPLKLVDYRDLQEVKT